MLARRTGMALDTGALVHARPTPSQGAMASAKARRRNMLGAFKVPERGRMTGRNILLVDDVVVITGATADAAARALKRAGGESADSGAGSCCPGGGNAHIRNRCRIAAMKPVIVYTTQMCPYCVRAKSLLGKKGVPYEEVDVMMDLKAREEMLARAGGARSVPQIFIGDTHVGGYDELCALEREGKLDPLLKT